MSNKYKILKDFQNIYINVCDILGDKSTSNRELNKLCKTLFSDRFKGVFSADAMIRLKDCECCIINTDPSNKSGTHWCALYKHKNIVYFFDSFGRNYKILSKFWKHKKWECVEFHRIESYKSENCGELCITFLIIFDRYKTKCIGVI